MTGPPAAYRTHDVRAAEAELMRSVDPGRLMQQAAAAVATEAARLLRSRAAGISGRRVALLAGAGNNGGDALWAGQRLRARGAAVTAVLTADGVHAEGLAAVRSAAARVIDARADGEAAVAAVAAAELVIDGLVGLRGSPGLREPAPALVAAIGAGVPVLAVDLPSGVDPDTGETPAEHVRADVTVTFGVPKPCLLLPPASRSAGRIVVVDLGFGRFLPDTPAVERLTPAAAAALWPVPRPDDDKYRRGVLGLVAGSQRYPGAAVLAGSGALEAGVGMLRYLGPEVPTSLVQQRWPEVVPGAGRVQAWVLGPGLDPEAGSQLDAAREALGSGLPCVVDAGALPLVSGDGNERLLLTPHAGELATLLGAERGDVEARPWRHAVRAAERLGATVLLKGATTLVATPGGRVRSQGDAPPWLATAGAGDVLAGIAGALLAAGLSPLDAGSVAALVHGRAAAAASGGGPVTAGAVAAAVPATVAGLLGPLGLLRLPDWDR